MRSAARIARAPALAAALAIAAAGPAAAQKDRVRKNDPSTDPYTRGEPEALARAGLVSLGGFEFGTTDTAEVDAYMAVEDIKWIESAHFELGFALGPYKVKQSEKKAIFAELTALSELLPEVDPKKGILDPWLRAHMYVQRLERVWDRFLGILQLDASVFPDGSKAWDMRSKYWGEGPYLGERGKYEVLILPSEAGHVSYLKNYYGLLIKRTQRWNVVDRDTLTANIHVQQGQLKDDGALHGHVAFNVAHNLLDGFKHYSYDTPIWLHEGLAHYLEREINPRHNTFDGSEGAIAEMTRKSNWEAETTKTIAAGDARRMAELIRLKSYGEMKLADHYTVWSMIDFLLRTRPAELARFLDALKGITNEQGVSDGSGLPDKHRDGFKEILGLGYAEFDEAWREWVAATY